MMLLLATGQAGGQETIRVSGKITDRETHKPLPFAQISLKNTALGTASNEDGNFSLSYPVLAGNDTLSIFYLGYKTATVPLNKRDTALLVIELIPSALQLSEVEIVGLDPKEVIRRAVERIPENYGKDSVLLTAFVRVRKMLNNRQAEFAEAVIEDLKDGYYHHPGSAREQDEKWEKSNIPLLIKGRVNSDTNIVNALADIGKNATCLSCYFKEDLVEFYPRTILDEKEFGNYDFKMEELSGTEGGKIFHIYFDQKPGLHKTLWKGELYIESGSYAIEKILLKPSLNGYETYEKRKQNKVYTLLNKDGWICEMPLGQTLVNYSSRGGTWALHSIRNEFWYTFTNLQTGQKAKYTYKSEVVVTDISRDPATIRSYSGDKTAGSGKRWDQIAGPPDVSFWAHYNYLPPEP